MCIIIDTSISITNRKSIRILAKSNVPSTLNESLLPSSRCVFSPLQYLFWILLLSDRRAIYTVALLQPRNTTSCLLPRVSFYSERRLRVASLGVLLFYVTDFPIKYRASTFTVRLRVKCYSACKCVYWEAYLRFSYVQATRGSVQPRHDRFHHQMSRELFNDLGNLTLP